VPITRAHLDEIAGRMDERDERKARLRRAEKALMRETRRITLDPRFLAKQLEYIRAARALAEME
jgi:hypothetical protein